MTTPTAENNRDSARWWTGEKINMRRSVHVRITAHAFYERRISVYSPNKIHLIVGCSQTTKQWIRWFLAAHSAQHSIRTMVHIHARNERERIRLVCIDLATVNHVGFSNFRSFATHVRAFIRSSSLPLFWADVAPLPTLSKHPTKRPFPYSHSSDEHGYHSPNALGAL